MVEDEQHKEQLAKLEEELRQQKRFEQISRTLFQVSNAVSLTTEPDQLYKSIHQALSSVIDASNFYIALYHQEEDKLTFPYCVDEVDGLYSSAIDVSKTASLPAEVILTGKPLMVSKEEMFKRRAQSIYLSPGGSISEIWLGVPLKISEKIIGVMAVQSYTDPHRYKPEDLDILTSVAGQVATAIEYKRAEEARRESEERYTAIVKQATDGIYLLDPDSKFVLDANESFLKMIGRTKKEIGTLYVYDFVAHQKNEIDRIIEQIIFRKNNRDKAFVVGERTYRKSDGTLFPIEASGSHISYSGKTVLCIIIRDITERKTAENALLESEHRYRRLVENTTDAIYLITLDAQIIDVNQAACKMFGYTREELLELSVQDLNPSTTDLKFTELYESLPEGTNRRFEIYHRRKDKSLFPAEVNTVVYKEQEHRYIVGIARDITDREQARKEHQKLEHQLQQAQKMDSIGRLAGGIAHDFNNMLSVILGYTELTLLETNSSHKVHDNLVKINQAAEHSANLTKQLLAFARKQTVSPKVINLNKTIGNILDMLRRLIGEDISLDWNPAENLWMTKADPIQINQVLTNLCVNSRDAISENTDGKIIISTKNTIASASEHLHSSTFDSEYVCIKVEDNGHGIDNEYIQQVFEPFFTTKDIGQGTGLGLSTVYGIIKQNNGHIKVESAPATGSSFFVYLPKHVGFEAQIKIPEKNRLIKKGEKETILVVEDEPAILSMCLTILEKNGYQVLGASTPGEAIKIAQANSASIDLLLTDVVLPEMNGPKLVDKIRTICPNSKQLFMSGYTADIISNQDNNNGIRLIEKPFSARTLLGYIQEILAANL